jgi:hypothetical protein
MFTTQTSAYSFYKILVQQQAKLQEGSSQEVGGEDAIEDNSSDSQRGCALLRRFVRLMEDIEKSILDPDTEPKEELSIKMIAQDALHILQKDDEEDYRSLIITGETSSGKSFLLNTLFRLFGYNKWDYAHICHTYYITQQHTLEAVCDAARMLLNMHNQGVSIATYAPNTFGDEESVSLLDEQGLLSFIQAELALVINSAISYSSLFSFSCFRVFISSHCLQKTVNRKKFMRSDEKKKKMLCTKSCHIVKLTHLINNLTYFQVKE